MLEIWPRFRRIRYCIARLTEKPALEKIHPAERQKMKIEIVLQIRRDEKWLDSKWRATIETPFDLLYPTMTAIDEAIIAAAINDNELLPHSGFQIMRRVLDRNPPALPSGVTVA